MQNIDETKIKSATKLLQTDYNPGVTLSVDGYEDITKFAQNQKDARKACAIEFAKENLGIDVEKEAQKIIENRKKKQKHIKYSTISKWISLYKMCN